MSWEGVGALKGGCFDQGCFQKSHLVAFVVSVAPRNAGIYRMKGVALKFSSRGSRGFQLSELFAMGPVQFS